MTKTQSKSIGKGTLDIPAYLEWYRQLVIEEDAPQYIGRTMYTVNPVTIMGTDRDDVEGDEYWIRTADGAVNAIVPVRFVKPSPAAERRLRGDDGHGESTVTR